MTNPLFVIMQELNLGGAANFYLVLPPPPAAAHEAGACSCGLTRLELGLRSASYSAPALAAMGRLRELGLGKFTEGDEGNPQVGGCSVDFRMHALCTLSVCWAWASTPRAARATRRWAAAEAAQGQ